MNTDNVIRLARAHLAIVGVGAAAIYVVGAIIK
jgi:hypothetical protein